jgi:hypothetical protein
VETGGPGENHSVNLFNTINILYINTTLHAKI